MATLLAFTIDQAARLSGLSTRQLRYWDKTDFFTPSYRDEQNRAFGRIYSFRDVVGLRTLGLLRREHGVSLQTLRNVGDWLKRHYHEPWSELRFYVAGKQVFFEDSELGARRSATTPGQLVIPIEMREVASTTEALAAKLQVRTADELGRIDQHRLVSHNAPVLAGTRIRTEAIWHFHEAGYDVDEILRQYPRLTVADVAAAIDFERQRRAKLAG